MNVRRGRTPFDPVAASLRDAAADSGQMFSTICDAVSFGGRKNMFSGKKDKESIRYYLPTRLSTKLFFRSDCRSRHGGGRAAGPLATVLLVRRGCIRSSGGTEPSALGGHLKARGQDPFLPASCPSASFSQITSTGFVAVDEMEL
jgi:hypothetical protein